jgi:hypothetical protein
MSKPHRKHRDDHADRAKHAKRTELDTQFAENRAAKVAVRKEIEASLRKRHRKAAAA